MASVRVTYEGFRVDQPQLVAQGSQIIRRVGDRVSRNTANLARIRVPVDTGALGRSIREDGGLFTGILNYQIKVSANTPYALFVHEGTRAHGPVRAKALRFVIGGRVIFAKRVRGVKARPFLRNAMDAAVAEEVG